MGTYAKLRSLTGRTGRELGATFESLAEALDKSGERGRIQFAIASGDEREYWNLKLDSKHCKVQEEKTKKADVEVVTASETWWEIAAGELSPVDAFFGGRLRVRGDVELAKRLWQRLACSEGRSEIC